MYSRSVLWAAICVTFAAAQHHHEPPSDQIKGTVRLLDGLGRLNHPVSTLNIEAQKFFNQGLSMIYGFNHGEAVRSFRRAAEIDPNLAMAHWGVALALGPNINAGMDDDAHKHAYAAVKQAQRLAASASPREQAYIAAIATRYSADPKADVAPLQKAYAEAMCKVAQRYPDDLDALTLAAESLMNLYPWKLWTLDGKPSPVTEEVVGLLEGVLERDPDHMGANHYYIHAVEASPQPARALPSAQRLGRLAPKVGHLVHMPAHIYMRTGDYEAAAQANIDAAEADKRYLEAGGVQGIYLSYYAHNLHFLSAAYSMQGRYAESLKAAEETRRVLEPLAKERVPGIEAQIAAALLVPVRFRDWDKVLKTPEPDAKQQTMRNLWQFARGMACAAKGDLKQARLHRDGFREAIAAIPEDRTYGNNVERSVMRLPLFLLDAKIAAAGGDLKQALGHLREAVVAEDELGYNEPPDWYYPPSREALGAVLLRLGMADEAEKVYRTDLKMNQRNGRSLFGLLESLRQQKKTEEAALIEPLFSAAWSKADRPLTVTELF
jgi:tetratricopeptide (TPR) repeat protein